MRHFLYDDSGSRLKCLATESRCRVLRRPGLGTSHTYQVIPFGGQSTEVDRIRVEGQ